MNIKNNKRKRESIEKIEKAFINLLQTKELYQISVSDICKMAELNRSTFYANYLDVYDLADRIRENLEADFQQHFTPSADSDARSDMAAKMFKHIKDNQLFYKTYFKLGYDNKHQMFTYNVQEAERFFGNKNINYHIEFFKSGLNAIIKMWLESGCKESPEEMAEIISSEYQGRV